MSCSEYEPKILGRQSLKCVCVGGGGTEGGGGEAVERGEGVEGGGTWSPTPALLPALGNLTGTTQPYGHSENSNGHSKVVAKMADILCVLPESNRPRKESPSILFIKNHIF